MATRSCHICGKEESAEVQMMVCSGCKAQEVNYCSRECQAKDWPEHKIQCKKARNKAKGVEHAPDATPASAPVQAVILSGGQNQPFSPTKTGIPSDHPLFSSSAANISPLSRLAGVPIIIWRLRTDDPMSHLQSRIRATLDNQSVTFLMVDPYTGWAPAEWQQGIGPVIIARVDKKPLTISALELVWMFCDHVSEVANEDGRAAAKRYHSPAAFQKWCVRYVESDPTRRREFQLPV
ncbi:hypothetical protein FRB94_009134 [Tulasnella sp. JGI-2019a]|nr:hypothetical protein FRB94_009134 [Tulasnella sp. JGI-2019a]